MRTWGLSDPTSDRWNERNSLRNANRVTAPIMYNGADQERIPTLETVSALEAAGAAVEFYEYPGEYHIKWQAAHRLAIYQRNIDWLKFWLMDVEPNHPAPMTERWRAMRVQNCIRTQMAPAYCAATRTSAIR